MNEPVSSRTRSRLRAVGNTAPSRQHSQQQMRTLDNIVESRILTNRVTRQGNGTSNIRQSNNRNNHRTRWSAFMSLLQNAHQDLIPLILEYVFSNENMFLDRSAVQNQSREYENPNPFHCCFCHQYYMEREPISTECGHVYCNECIFQALEISNRCRICQSIINPNNIIRFYI